MKLNEKIEARKLRLEGCSVLEIAKKISVAKSSVSVWVRDIELTEKQKQLLYLRNKCSLAKLNGAKANHDAAEVRHLKFRHDGYKWAEKDESFRLVCALYWGEGKRSGRRNSFAVSNADPSMLNMIVNWICEQNYKFRFTVQCYLNNGLSESNISEWWLSKINKLAIENFTKFQICTINRASQQKKIGSLPYGTATVMVHKTELFYNVMGGIDYLRNMSM